MNGIKKELDLYTSKKVKRSDTILVSDEKQINDIEYKEDEAIMVAQASLSLSESEQRLQAFFSTEISSSNIPNSNLQNDYAPAHSWQPDRGSALPQIQNNPVLMMCVNHRRDLHRPSCAARGSLALLAQLTELAAEKGLQEHILRIHCLGHCQFGPAARLAPGGEFFLNVTAEQVEDLLAALEKQIAAHNLILES